MGEANFYYFTCLKFVYEQQPFFSLLLHDGLLASTVKWGPRLSPSRRCRRPDHRRPRRSIIRAEGQRRSAPVEGTRTGAAGGGEGGVVVGGRRRTERTRSGEKGRKRESATPSICEPRRITRFSFVVPLLVTRGLDSKS